MENSNRNLTLALGKYSYGKDKGSMKGLIQFFKDAGSPLSWIPTAPAIAERSTGKVSILVWIFTKTNFKDYGLSCRFDGWFEQNY